MNCQLRLWQKDLTKPVEYINCALKSGNKNLLILKHSQAVLIRSLESFIVRSLLFRRVHMAIQRGKE